MIKPLAIAPEELAAIETRAIAAFKPLLEGLRATAPGYQRAAAELGKGLRRAVARRA